CEMSCGVFLQSCPQLGQLIAHPVRRGAAAGMAGGKRTVHREYLVDATAVFGHQCRRNLVEVARAQIPKFDAALLAKPHACSRDLMCLAERDARLDEPLGYIGG